MSEGFDKKFTRKTEQNQSTSGENTRKGYSGSGSNNRTQLDRINEQLNDPKIQGKARQMLEEKKRKLSKG
ncbi:MAG: hypothetical protein AAGG51_09070 [Cyanobacteria bacterium P01_G01_bin.54]